MILFKSTEELHKHIQQQKNSHQKVGFVPTMGALHAGHISLIVTSKKNCDVTVCSIFVNPAQFNDINDFNKYPITIEQDIFLLEQAGCDVLFLPSVAEMYPVGLPEKKHYNLGFIETVFEGEHRPGHFNGVCVIVEKLLNIVAPHKLFLGQKDYQQCIVIKKLIELTQTKIDVVICPTERETNGLAMSSRNARLSETMKGKAKIIYELMGEVKTKLKIADNNELLQQAQSELLKNGFDKIDYFAIANAETLEPIVQWNGTTKIVLLAAAFTEGVRLIDNMVLN